MATPPTPKTVALRIELLEVVPLVWRRVLVADQWTLASLHHYLQWVLGWTDSHAHEFEVGDGLIAPDWWIQEAGSEEEAGRYRDERRVSVAAVVSELGIRGDFLYRYDMGDGWEHRIVVESPPTSTMSNPRLPVCIAGENACPPEDVGGPPHELLKSCSSGFLVIGAMSSTRTRRAGSAGSLIRRALTSIGSTGICLWKGARPGAAAIDLAHAEN